MAEATIDGTAITSSAVNQVRPPAAASLMVMSLGDGISHEPRRGLECRGVAEAELRRWMI